MKSTYVACGITCTLSEPGWLPHFVSKTIERENTYVDVTLPVDQSNN